jgi:hypothetical protein
VVQAGRVSQSIPLSKHAVRENHDPVLKSHLRIK